MTEFIAALPMYDWPEVRSETDALWAQMRDALRSSGFDAPDALVRRNADLPAIPGGIRDERGRVIAPDPKTLSPHGLDLPTLWRHPALLFAQTCWGPMEQGLMTEVRIVGQPDYSSFEGGEGEFYSSAILVRQSDAITASPAAGLDALISALGEKRFAFNGTDSISGLIAFERDMQAKGQGLDVFGERIETGSHRTSIRMVSKGQAEICTIDCRTWDLAKRFEPAAADLAVVGWTTKRKGLPYIASRHLPSGAIETLRDVLAAVTAKTASP